MFLFSKMVIFSTLVSLLLFSFGVQEKLSMLRWSVKKSMLKVKFTASKFIRYSFASSLYIIPSSSSRKKKEFFFDHFHLPYIYLFTLHYTFTTFIQQPPFQKRIYYIQTKTPTLTLSIFTATLLLLYNHLQIIQNKKVRYLSFHLINYVLCTIDNIFIQSLFIMC